jgi:uncharacterized protein YjfI (DUF2170 family)
MYMMKDLSDLQLLNTVQKYQMQSIINTLISPIIHLTNIMLHFKKMLMHKMMIKEVSRA